MEAIISQDDGTIYASPVLAVRQRGWQTEVLAFDSAFARLKRIRGRIFLYRGSSFDGEKGAWKGCGWLLSDRALFKAARSRNGAAVKDFPALAPYAQKLPLPGWLPLNRWADYVPLLGWGGDFHDFGILCVERQGEDLEVRMNSMLGCLVTLRFEQVIEEAGLENVGSIYDSDLIFRGAGGREEGPKSPEDGAEPPGRGAPGGEGCVEWRICGWSPSENGKDDGLISKPYVVSRRASWLPEAGLYYRQNHMGYRDLRELFDDLKEVLPDATLGEKQIEVPLPSGGVVTVRKRFHNFVIALNGRRWSSRDYDVYEDLLDLLEAEGLSAVSAEPAPGGEREGGLAAEEVPGKKGNGKMKER